jgi:hypothetical protein
MEHWMGVERDIMVGLEVWGVMVLLPLPKEASEVSEVLALVQVRKVRMVEEALLMGAVVVAEVEVEAMVGMEVLEEEGEWEEASRVVISAIQGQVV